MTQLRSSRALITLVSVLASSSVLWAPLGCSSDAGPGVEAGGSNGSAGASSGAGSGNGGTLSASGSANAGGSVTGSAGTPIAGSGVGEEPSGANGGNGASAGTPSLPGAGSGPGGTGSGGSGGTAGAGGTGGDSSGGTKPIKVWIAGDSTVQNCNSACPCGWGSQFDALFNDNVTVVNSAVGGRSIQSWLYEASVGDLGQNGECSLTSPNYDKRWTAMLDANTGMKAGDFLFIQFGINDTDTACPKHVGTTLFKTYLTTMAQAAKERGAQAVFVTPVSAIICSGSVAQPTRGRFATATMEAATAAGVPLLDLHQLSIDLYDSLAFCPNDGNYGAGKLGDFFCQDHTHFEAAGAKRIAGLVSGALEGAGLSLAKYRK